MRTSSHMDWLDGSERAAAKRFTFHDPHARTVTDGVEQGRKARELTGHRNDATPAGVYDRRCVRKANAVR